MTHDVAVSDADLARALIASDRRAAVLAWQRFRPLIRGMARRALGSSGEVDDVVQDVFSRLFARVGRLREPEALRAFVITVTKRTLGHELRRRRARAHLRVDVGQQPLLLVGERADATARHALVYFHRLLARLRERERRAFVLRFVVRMDAHEVAAAMGVSVPTARRAFSRAHGRIMVWASRHAFLREYASLVVLPSLEPLSVAGEI